MVLRHLMNPLLLPWMVLLTRRWMERTLWPPVSRKQSMQARMPCGRVIQAKVF